MSLSEEEEDDEYVVDVMRAMFDFTGKAEANQISFMKNDVLQVLPRGATRLPQRTNTQLHCRLCRSADH
jgi:hypothetical protein